MKTKNHYIAIVAIFILAISVYSCRKDFLPDNVKLDPKINWANEYFVNSVLPNEGNLVDAHDYVGNIIVANQMSKKKENMKAPIWRMAKAGKNSLCDFVEVPLRYTSKIIPMLYKKENGESTFSITENAILKATLDRLVIYKKKNGKINKRIITFVPTKNYLSRHNGDISHNRINKLDKDFEGMLFYRQWDGKYESALIIKDGKPIRKLLLSHDKINFKEVAYREEICEQFELNEWFVDCTWGDTPVPDCGAPYPVLIDIITVCRQVGPNDPCLDPENFDDEMCRIKVSQPESPEEQAEFEALYGLTTSEDAPTQPANQSVISSTATTRTIAYDWVVAKNPLVQWMAVSHCTGTHIRVGSEWRWVDLKHNNFSVTDKPSIVTVEVTVNGNPDGYPTIGTYYAGIEVKFNINAWVLFKGFPIGAPSRDADVYSPLFYSNTL